MLVFIFYAFILVVWVQIIYYIGVFSQFSFAKKQLKKRQQFPVSVIISCKNEAENLQNNLPVFLKQNYSDYEFMLVDDASTDATHQVMQEFVSQYVNIQILHIPRDKTYIGNKKNALTKAIAMAKNEHLLFTDADCIPRDANWIQKIANSFTEDKQIVLGYGGYKKTSGWLNKLIRYETLLTAWQYFSYARIGIPYMGVGRNMGYTKALFYKAKGFTSHQDIRSGDDDLFVNQIATKENLALCWEADSHTLSNAKTTWTSWLKQKRRHITTATAYKPVHQFLLGLFFLSQFLFYTLFVFLIGISFNTKFVLIAVATRYLFYYISLIPTSKKLKETDLIFWAPFLELSLILIQIRIFVSNLWEKPKEW